MVETKVTCNNTVGKQSDHKYCIHNTPSHLVILYTKWKYLQDFAIFVWTIWTSGETFSFSLVDILSLSTVISRLGHI